MYALAHLNLSTASFKYLSWRIYGSASKGRCINRREPQPIVVGARLTPRNTLFLLMPNLVVLSQTVRALLKKFTSKCDPLPPAFQGHSRSSELTHRSATNDFLLTFHSNHGPLSYRFRDKRRFPPKIANFLPRAFCAPTEGVPLGIGYRRS